MIIEDEKNQEESKIINLEVLTRLATLYKFPIILAGIGLLFLFIGTIYIIKSQIAPQEVVFSSESSASAKLAAKIRIDIEGAVIVPGVYQMSEGERISDALVIAGGLSADADREWVAKNLNRAAKLTDGGKIYIPSAASAASGQITNDKLQIANSSGNPGQLLGVTTGKVNINTASQSELESLPGVGPVTAGKIISGRPYQSVEELKSKKAVGNALFEKIKDLLVLF